jgi:nicotinamide mononucleotide transporter
MQFYGFIVWKKNMNQKTHEVNKRHMTVSGRLLLLLSVILVTVIGGYLLSFTNDPMPYVDAFTTGASIIAMIISIKMYSEQWWIWCGVNIFSIYLWYGDLMTGSDNYATLLMWSVYLVNAIIMLVKWEKEIRITQKEGVL